MERMNSVTSDNSQVSDIMDQNNLSEVKQPSENFFEKLFSVPTQSPDVTLWLQAILEATKFNVCSGLKKDFKKSFLAKYEPEEGLSFLAPPKVNKEILPNLSAL